MKTAIIYTSYHRKNTVKLADTFTAAFDADVFPLLTNAATPDTAEYDLLGIGSGVYKWKFHEKLLLWISNLPEGEGRPVFLFSTSAFNNAKFHDEPKKLLEDKGYEVIGDFHCKGSSHFLPAFLLGGMAKDRPNASDLEAANRFADRIRQRMEHRKPL